MRIKVVYIISHIDKALAFEWIAKNLDRKKFHLYFILLNPCDSELERYLKLNEIDVFRVHYESKKNLFSAFFEVTKIIFKHNIKVVHTHLFDASIVGLLAALFSGIKKRIHTRHNSTIHHVYFPNAVKYDKFINWLSTDIIAISDVVRKVLVDMEGVNPDKISMIHHGFCFDENPQPGSNRIADLGLKYNKQNRHPVIGVISRYIHWKGIQYIIPAYKQLLKDYPNALLILANAAGPYESEIRQLLSKLPHGSFVEIPFEKDVFALYNLFDVFVHVPIDGLSEAFGQTYVEALSVGVPSVVTRSGIAHELILNEKNAIEVAYQDSDAIYNGISKLLEDKSLRKKLILQGKKDVEKRFNIDGMIRKLEVLYNVGR